MQIKLEIQPKVYKCKLLENNITK